MSSYVIETLGRCGTPQQRSVFESDDPKDVISRTIDALSALSRAAFEDGDDSIIAAVKDENGKYVYSAKLSFKAKWLS